MKEELSKRLKNKRKELGLDIEEVVERTKIHPSVIKALEEGEWGKISYIYLKGFLRIYCSFLGEKYDEQILKDVYRAEEKKLLQGRLKRREASRIKSFKEMVLPLFSYKSILILSISVLLIIVFSSLTKNLRVRLSKKKSSSTNKGVVLKQGAFEDKYLSSSEEIFVTITARKKCFVRAKIEGQTVFEGILRKGVVESWKAKKEIDLKISDGTAVDIEVNGKRIPPLTKIRKSIKSFKVTPSGISVVK